MAEQSLVYVLMRGGAELRAQVDAVSPRVRTLSPRDVEADPALLGSVEIAYGGISRAWRDRAPRLRWIHATGAGVNAWTTPDLIEREIIVTNTRGIHAQPIAEQMFGHLLQHIRQLHVSWDRQKLRIWDGDPQRDKLGMLEGLTLGLLGVGALGGMAARVGRAFNMRVIGLRRTAEAHPDVERIYPPDELLAFLGETDVLMNTLPLTEKTRGLLGAREIAALKPRAIFMNYGRGATVDTDALMAALREGRLGAALLDVTDPEPLPADHPLWGMENVSITPHYAGSHPGYEERGGAIFRENLRRYLAGEPLINVIDKREGY